MKIAMIGVRGIPVKSGGAEAVVDHLATLLVELGQDVTVYCRNPYCIEKPETYKGVKLKYLPTINTKHTEAIVHSFLATVDAIFEPYDIVHYHAMGNALFLPFPRFRGKRTVITLHGLDYEREKWGGLAKFYLKFCERIASNYPEDVISCSKKIKEHYREKYNDNIAFIPNGVDVCDPLPLKKLKRFGLRKNGYILYLGRIVPEKGIHYLLDAFEKVKTDLELVIAGDVTHTDDYFKSLEKYKDKRIIFTGPLYGDEKTEAFSNAALFVLPSTMEGMPIVLLEAMSFGLCSLVSDIKENTDVYHDFTFRSKDSGDLAEKLTYLISNLEIAKKTGAKCREHVRKKYQWMSVAKQTLAFYNGKKP